MNLLIIAAVITIAIIIILFFTFKKENCIPVKDVSITETPEVEKVVETKTINKKKNKNQTKKNGRF